MKSLLAAAALIAALTGSAASAQPVIGAMKLANPASQYCISIGGRLERHTGPAGEHSTCVIEEWKLFHATHPAHVRH
jgi:putative hemolysin